LVGLEGGKIYIYIREVRWEKIKGLAYGQGEFFSKTVKEAKTMEGCVL